MIASSDLHHPRQITSWKSAMRCERSVPAILEAIRAQELSFAFYSDPLCARSLANLLKFRPLQFFPQR